MLKLAKYSHRLYKLGTDNVQVIGETPSSISVSPTGYGPDILTNKITNSMEKSLSIEVYDSYVSI
jgi:hypothetical protein